MTNCAFTANHRVMTFSCKLLVWTDHLMKMYSCRYVYSVLCPHCTGTESRLGQNRNPFDWDVLFSWSAWSHVEVLQFKLKDWVIGLFHNRGGYRVGNLFFYFLHMTLRSDLPWTIHFWKNWSFCALKNWGFSYLLFTDF